MKDRRGEIFYIGKAKNLRARLKSYFVGTDSRIFVQFLEQILDDLDIVVVRNDIEALVLERELIKQHDPRFNIMLKDDKNYILLKLKRAKNEGARKLRYPRLEIVRRAKKDHARYFGPYPSAGRLRTTLDLINKNFRLRICTDQIIDNRTRPCIQFQIGRCPAPCVYDVPEYSQEIENVALFLSGQYQEIERRLSAKMWALSQAEQYEKAAQIRDQIEALKTSMTSQVVTDMNRMRDQDIIGFYRRGPEIEIVQILIRHGSWHKNYNYPFSDQPFPSEEILCSFIEQAYGVQSIDTLPHEILLPQDIRHDLEGLSEELTIRSGRKVQFLAPQKGKQKRLIEIANKNAHIALDERLSDHDAHIQSLDALRAKLDLAVKPKRIECIDISLIQGSEPFGSLVVFIDGKPDKSKYRLFKIKSVDGMDDFAMIHEVVKRRIKRGIEASDLPDLLLIDGGKGQLNAALKAIEELNVLVMKSGFYIAGIAKARTQKESSGTTDINVLHSSERLFVPNEPEPIMLNPHTFERYLVERIRDEAHRFALTAHRKSRSKRTLQSELLSLPGIGKTRALKILRHFGSVALLKSAQAEEIASVIKINVTKAQELLSLLNKP